MLVGILAAYRDARLSGCSSRASTRWVEMKCKGRADNIKR